MRSGGSLRTSPSLRSPPEKEDARGQDSRYRREKDPCLRASSPRRRPISLKRGRLPRNDRVVRRGCVSDGKGVTDRQPQHRKPPRQAQGERQKQGARSRRAENQGGRRINGQDHFQPRGARPRRQTEGRPSRAVPAGGGGQDAEGGSPEDDLPGRVSGTPPPADARV